jgi:hypothetical protein
MACSAKEHLATGDMAWHSPIAKQHPKGTSGHRLRTSLTTDGPSARTSSSFSFPTNRDPCCRKSLRYSLYTTLGYTDPATVVDNKRLGHTRCAEADSVQARRPSRQRILECSWSGWCLGTKSLAANAGASSRAMIFAKQSLIDRKASDAVRPSDRLSQVFGTKFMDQFREVQKSLLPDRYVNILPSDCAVG